VPAVSFAGFDGDAELRLRLLDARRGDAQV